MEFGYKKHVEVDFASAVEKVRQELAKEGFGVIAEINAREIFKKKLDVDFENYIILGACHPATAHEVLEMQREMGLFLPCNVLVYQTGEKVFVSAVLPTVAMGMIENAELLPIAKGVEDKLKKVVDAI
jgi:uncharacterized protein (DUF302 family)